MDPAKPSPSHDKATPIPPPPRSLVVDPGNSTTAPGLRHSVTRGDRSAEDTSRVQSFAPLWIPALCPSRILC